MSEPINVGIVGLGRWAKVLTRAARASSSIRIVTGYSRSQEKRDAFQAEFADTGFKSAPTMEAMLADPSIKGVIITVPNEQHLSVAEQIAKAGKHIYTEKPIAAELSDGLKIEALQKQYGVTVTVGHSARLLAGVRMMKEKIDAGELGRVGFIEANFSNERALELTPQTWRWYKDRAPGGPLSQLAVHMFDIVHLLGGDVSQVSSIASKLSPVGAEVDDHRAGGGRACGANEHVHHEVGDEIGMSDPGLAGLGAELFSQEDPAPRDTEDPGGQFEDHAVLVLAVLGETGEQQARAGQGDAVGGQQAVAGERRAGGPVPRCGDAEGEVARRLGVEPGQHGPIDRCEHRRDRSSGWCIEGEELRDRATADEADRRSIDAAHEVVPDVDVGDVSDNDGEVVFLADLDLQLERRDEVGGDVV